MTPPCSLPVYGSADQYKITELRTTAIGKITVKTTMISGVKSFIRDSFLDANRSMFVKPLETELGNLNGK